MADLNEKTSPEDATPEKSKTFFYLLILMNATEPA